MRAFVKNHIVPLVACVLAVASMFLVPPNAGYLDYIEFKTLCSVFCVLAVVGAFSNAGFFIAIAKRIVQVFKTTRSCVIALVWTTLIGAMFMTNDVALLTFLPLSYAVLGKVTDNRRLLPWTFILQNTAANLGGMILPFGNPHNLYLYTMFSIPTGEFILTMLPVFLTAVVLITIGCFCFKSQDLELQEEVPEQQSWKAIIYGALFVITLLFVLRVIPYWIGTLIVFIVLLFMDRQALKTLDYGLLITFLGFFIFAGNLSSVPEVREFFTSLLSWNELLVEVLTCQVMSNLPTTLLMAPFTNNWATLLVATDIGGTGTPIASLASLITLKYFLKQRPHDGGYFTGMFLAVNFTVLIILFFVASLYL